MINKIREILDMVVHPESGVGIHEAGLVEAIKVDSEEAGSVVITLRFERPRDPFAVKIKRRVEGIIAENYPSHKCQVIIKEGAVPRSVEASQKLERLSTTEGVAHTIAVASGKGGVGKSSVTASLAIALRDMGYRVGVLDADIYGPSQAKMFGVEGYLPEAIAETREDGQTRELIIPAENHGIKIMSIAFFIKDNDPLLWRGAMASNALKQLLHQTKWGALDFLLVDLPPGTGDIHLTILSATKFSSAVIVSTPQGVALADVVRGVEMFRHSNINTPLAGIIENMAYFEPEDITPAKRYYLFGEGGASRYAAESGIPLLGEIPIYESVMQGGESGTPAAASDERVKGIYRDIAEGVIKGLY